MVKEELCLDFFDERDIPPTVQYEAMRKKFVEQLNEETGETELVAEEGEGEMATVFVHGCLKDFSKVVVISEQMTTPDFGPVGVFRPVVPAPAYARGKILSFESQITLLRKIFFRINDRKMISVP